MARRCARSRPHWFTVEPFPSHVRPTDPISGRSDPNLPSPRSAVILVDRRHDRCDYRPSDGRCDRTTTAITLGEGGRDAAPAAYRPPHEHLARTRRPRQQGAPAPAATAGPRASPRAAAATTLAACAARRRRFVRVSQITSTRATTSAIPPAVTRQGGCEPCLPVDAAEHRLHVRRHGLDLDDEQGAPHRVERQHVDRAALAVAREGHFDRDVPAQRPAVGGRRHRPAARGLVEQPVQPPRPASGSAGLRLHRAPPRRRPVHRS